MIAFPNCKINLGLRVIRKRSDGYHDLESVFYPLPFKDALETIPIKGNGSPIVNFSASGLVIEGKKEENLCVKAFEILKKDFPELPSIQMHLYKAIFPGAGLGGGSADGSFVIKLLDRQFKLGLSAGQLLDYASQLGSDCPFFIINKPCLVRGKGELLEVIPLDLSAYKFIIIYPGFSISTAWAFEQVTATLESSDTFKVADISDTIRKPLTAWKEELKNDFEGPVFNRYHELKKIKEVLYSSGAIYASMSGSGSSVYGIFNNTITPSFSFPEKYFIKELAGQTE